MSSFPIKLLFSTKSTMGNSLVEVYNVRINHMMNLHGCPQNCFSQEVAGFVAGRLCWPRLCCCQAVRSSRKKKGEQILNAHIFWNLGFWWKRTHYYTVPWHGHWFVFCKIKGHILQDRSLNDPNYQKTEKFDTSSSTRVVKTKCPS